FFIFLFNANPATAIDPTPAPTISTTPVTTSSSGAPSAATTPLGSKPASVISNTTTIIATVIGIDRQKLTISVKGPKGKPDIYRIKNAALLKDIAVNDEVKIVLYDAMAASFTAPAPAAAQKK
ncbi:MAG: hypothetical protein EBY02_01295, partial [Burkholderiaceae bacterium]|nr:hypothetical protein [Burkholderiaceae bacterium]